MHKSWKEFLQYLLTHKLVFTLTSTFFVGCFLCSGLEALTSILSRHWEIARRLLSNRLLLPLIHQSVLLLLLTFFLFIIEWWLGSIGIKSIWLLINLRLWNTANIEFKNGMIHNCVKEVAIKFVNHVSKNIHKNVLLLTVKSLWCPLLASVLSCLDQACLHVFS